ncbi:MAG: T9SS type A sorting domain-containing protein [Candidatus Cloacimonetes bacterium]|nr:T9SS type A sorting domain-containing protein [Candidatus Cloacimonadota bacterium]
MKKKMVILLFLSLFFLLNALDLDLEALDQHFNEGKELLLNRLDYGTTMAYLPSSLAIALACQEFYPLEQEINEWDPENDQWLEMYNYSFVYDGDHLSQYTISISMQGQLYQIITDYTWVDGFLTETSLTTIYMEININSSREYFYYTEDDLFDSFLMQGWQPDFEFWLDLERWQSTIVDGKITVMDTEDYDPEGEVWMPADRETFTWDSELIASYLTQYYDEDMWKNDSMHLNYYYPCGLMDYIIYQSWVSGAWINDHRTTYTYEGNLHTFDLREKWENEAWVNDAETFKYYDDSDRPYLIHQNDYIEGEWVNNQEIHIYYTNASEPDVLPQAYASLTVFPNPFNPSTTLNWQIDGSISPENLYIYDLRGRKVDQLKVVTGTEGRGSVTWNGIDSCGNILPSGIYIFRLEGVETTAKMLLLK